jgi:hypothetical protein
VPVWVYITMGRISIRPDVRFIVWFALIATAPLAWVTVHLQLVGYRGRELLVANYWRQARISFEHVEHVEAVEPVWWYKGRLVRVRFNSQNALRLHGLLYADPSGQCSRSLNRN